MTKTMSSLFCTNVGIESLPLFAREEDMDEERAWERGGKPGSEERCPSHVGSRLRKEGKFLKGAMLVLDPAQCMGHVRARRYKGTRHGPWIKSPGRAQWPWGRSLSLVSAPSSPPSLSWNTL
jgi:hypothetical protein